MTGPDFIKKQQQQKILRCQVYTASIILQTFFRKKGRSSYLFTVYIVANFLMESLILMTHDSHKLATRL